MPEFPKQRSHRGAASGFDERLHPLLALLKRLFTTRSCRFHGDAPFGSSGKYFRACSVLFDDWIAESANCVDFDLNDIALLQVDGRLACVTDATWRAGRDDVACGERHKR